MTIPHTKPRAQKSKVPIIFAPTKSDEMNDEELTIILPPSINWKLNATEVDPLADETIELDDVKQEPADDCTYDLFFIILSL